MDRNYATPYTGPKAPGYSQLGECASDRLVGAAQGYTDTAARMDAHAAMSQRIAKECSPEQDRGQLSHATQSLTNRISELEAAFEMLEHRLAAVLVPQPPQTSNAIRGPEPMLMGSQAAVTIQMQVSRLESLINHLNDIRSRVDV